MKKSDTHIENLAIHTIRGLALDAPHKARSGHQGTAMALAPVAHILFSRVMNYDSSSPDWPDRDRFILSAGHASILLYAFLYLTGFGLSLEGLKNFRQYGSPTPGHPEAGCTPGVEVTTGPLGQGFGNGVGMAIAERSLRERFGAEICNHNIYVLCGDGDLAEGVSHEAASLAGHLGLGKLIYVYDDNHVSIDGATDLWLSDDPVGRFKAYGWHTLELGEASEDLNGLENALQEARAEESAPSLIVLRSHIGYPSPTLTDNPATHGYAFFEDEIKEAKAVMGLPPEESFYVPKEILEFYGDAGKRGADLRRKWEKRFQKLSKENRIYLQTWTKQGADNWEADLPKWPVGEQVATRKASAACLSSLAESFPSILAGGADLTGNTGTKLDSEAMSKSSGSGRQIFFGVREHAMGSLMVGMALHGGIVPVGGTFLVFSDYMRPALRLAAMSEARLIFVFTHDSVGVGEDGPTHQPIEHIASLRSIPNLLVMRPADATETAGAWQTAMKHNGPVALVLTRQDVPVLETSSKEKVSRGGYVIYEPSGKTDIQLLATGSEVSLAIEAAKELAKKDINAQVLSLPCLELFKSESQNYQNQILKDVSRLAIEAGISFGWGDFAQETVSIDRFGASAPGAEVMRRLGITVDHICEKAKKLVNT